MLRQLSAETSSLYVTMAKPVASIKVGAKVICIDDAGFGLQYGERVPVRGAVYTVRDILTSNGQKCYRLREIINQAQMYAQGLMECSFKATRFAAYHK